MFGRLFRRDSEAESIASGLYGAIVAQARNPVLYTDFGVADTVTGRFEMVTLHLILVLDRLQREIDGEKAVGQRIFDLYCADMDNSLRELGFGDLGVPKRMKNMAEAFYGRAGTYREALAAGDAAGLGTVIARNVFPDGGAGEARALALYGLASATALALTPVAQLRAGGMHFADLAAYAPSRASAEVVA
jgi:cytochrome b pre-mRNA-processing protein 3